MGDEHNTINNSLLLAPNYVKDVLVTFGKEYTTYGFTRQKVTIEIEVDTDQANRLRTMPGMDNAQFVAFLMPCIQTSIYKTIDQGMDNKNQNVMEISEDIDY